VTYRRLLLGLLALGLLACLFIAVRRERHEHRANRVEIVLDDADFQALAQSYGYDQRKLLRALKAAGLTSLAVQEELGSEVVCIVPGGCAPTRCTCSPTMRRPRRATQGSCR